ncbi:MAG: hypothetical protein ACRC0J_23130, partial [Shewanella oncorhynchi]
VDDAGGSNLNPSPQVVVRSTGGSTDMTFMATTCRMGGYVTAYQSAAQTIGNIRYSNNIDLEDQVTSGYSRVAAGVHYMDSAVVTAPVGGTASAALVRSVVTQNNEAINRTELRVRDTSSGARATCVVNTMTYREAGNATTVITSLSNVYPSGAFTTDATGTYQVGVSSTATDGSSITFLVSPISATTQKRIVFTLKEG